jgi:hypothetical protein
MVVNPAPDDDHFVRDYPAADLCIQHVDALYAW